MPLRKATSHIRLFVLKQIQTKSVKVPLVTPASHTASAQSHLGHGYLAGLDRQSAASCTAPLESTELEGGSQVHKGSDRRATSKRLQGSEPGLLRVCVFRGHRRGTLRFAFPSPRLSLAFLSNSNT